MVVKLHASNLEIATAAARCLAALNYDPQNSSAGAMIELMAETRSRLDQAAGDFASWANSDPSRLQKPAIVGLITYLIDRYPCPHEAKTPHHSHG